MLLIGLTGGIATGKSTVSQLLQTKHQIPVVDADQIARQVVEPGQPAFAEILREFQQDGITRTRRRGESASELVVVELDRERLGAVVFADPQKRKRLNDITHPRIRREILWQILRLFLQGHEMVVLDAPLLMESGLDRWMDLSVVVYWFVHVPGLASPLEVEEQRFALRNPSLTPEQRKQRIQAQMNLEEKCRRATVVIDNSGTLQETEAQLADLVQSWRAQEKRRWRRRYLRLAAAACCCGCCYCGWMWWFGRGQRQ